MFIVKDGTYEYVALFLENYIEGGIDMDIQIKNEDAAISTCQQLISYNNQCSADIENLEGSLKRITTDWESNGHDKESYVAELEKQINNLRTMEKAINDLANGIIKYVENNKATSSATM